MKISLNKFKQIIDETILERGLSYFKNGNITELTEISTGKYKALVSGTKNYTVKLEV